MGDTIESLQATIQGLNARIMAADTLAEDLQRQLADAQHATDVQREDFEKKILDMSEDHDTKAKRLIEDANAAIASAQNMATLYQRRWEAQNVYVIAIESQSVDGVRDAIKQHEAAKLALQIEMLKAMQAA